MNKVMLELRCDKDKDGHKLSGNLLGSGFYDKKDPVPLNQFGFYKIEYVQSNEDSNWGVFPKKVIRYYDVSGEFWVFLFTEQDAAQKQYQIPAVFSFINQASFGNVDRDVLTTQNQQNIPPRFIVKAIQHGVTYEFITLDSVVDPSSMIAKEV